MSDETTKPEVEGDTGKMRRLTLDDLREHQAAGVARSEQTREHLTLQIGDMRKDICEHFDAHEKTLKSIVNQVGEMGGVLTSLVASRTASERARAGLSDADLSHQASLGVEIAARKELAVKVDTLTEMQATQLSILVRLDKITSNPQVKILVAVVTTAALSWAASRGLTIK